ncbi:MAG: cyclic pyranopterin monophosphate synthase MoaC [Nitrospirae bacterium]|nr:cyclic pyranopterin monophosphate synthase MoaC [Nitrospirota bacterium]
MADLTHFNIEGRAKMVDVSEKAATFRTAIATGMVYMQPETLNRIQEGKIAKGDVLAVAQVAGIMGAKRTPDLIPMCHPLLLTGVDISFTEYPEPDKNGLCAVGITATVKVGGQTGVEMEALTATAVAALTIYDMCKAIDKGMILSEICLQKKTGGKSGTYVR